jgi:solute carrier family 6 GABA transporter-like protein 1
MNQLRRDLNIIVAVGKNWSIPLVWGPVLRYISAPILAIIASFSYPDFYARGRMDPLHIFGFTCAHIGFFLVVVGLVLPRAFDIFVRPEKRDEFKVAYAPQEPMPTFVARIEGIERVEEGAPDSGEEAVKQ